MKLKKLAFVSQPEYFKFHYESDLNEFYEVREFRIYENGKLSNFDDLIEFNPDYVIFFRGDFFDNSLLAKLSGLKIALSTEPFPRYIEGRVEYTFDSIRRYLHFRKAMRSLSFDYVFHYDPASEEVMRNDGIGISGVFYLPIANKTFKPKNLEKKWDLFFIGRDTAHREKYFGYLKHKYNFLHIAHGINGVDLIDYINSSKICLNIHAEDEISWEPRVQMLLSTGAFVISEKITPNSILTPGVDYVEIQNREQLFSMVDHYIKSKEERDIIANNGLNKIKLKLNSSINFPKLINDIEDGIYKKYQVSPPSVFWNILNSLYNLIIACKNKIEDFR